MAVSAVLDACVLVPAALRDTLLRAAAANLYRVHWSADILDELTRAIVEKLRVTAENAVHLRHTMDVAFADAAVPRERYLPLIPAMANHPKDRHVLAAAVASGAQVIVTVNLSDFPVSALAPHGVEARSPDDFLCSLFDLDPALLTQIVVAQAADLRHPPLAVDALLDRLATVHHAPTFAERVRRHRAIDP